MQNDLTGDMWTILLFSRDSDWRDRFGQSLRVAGLAVEVVGDELGLLKASQSISLGAAILHGSAEEIVELDLVRTVRAAGVDHFLPVMVIADTDAETDRCKLLEAGAADAVHQDIGAAELVCRARSILRFKEVHTELASSRAILADTLSRDRKMIQELQQDNERLQQMCLTDPLTNLVNVRSFNQILEHEFKVASRYSQALSLLMLDIDGFTEINNRFGHPSGDFVLKELGAVLRRSIRDSDVVARVGGEEFTILLPHASYHQARQLAERIRYEIASRQFMVFGNEIRLTVSIGVATWPTCAEVSEPNMLLYFADQALLIAKDAGRDSVICASELDMDVRRKMWQNFRHQCQIVRGDADPADVESQAMLASWRRSLQGYVDEGA
jgi:diguanylate cyclase (GGDEF)-like protein